MRIVWWALKILVLVDSGSPQVYVLFDMSSEKSVLEMQVLFHMNSKKVLLFVCCKLLESVGVVWYKLWKSEYSYVEALCQ